MGEVASKLRDVLAEKKIKTPYAVSTILPHGVKTCSVNVPRNEDDIDSWVRENYDKVVKVPLPFHQVSYVCETKSLEGDTKTIEVE